jgi:hypothetical protein
MTEVERILDYLISNQMNFAVTGIKEGIFRIETRITFGNKWIYKHNDILGEENDNKWNIYEYNDTLREENDINEDIKEYLNKLGIIQVYSRYKIDYINNSLVWGILLYDSGQSFISRNPGLIKNKLDVLYSIYENYNKFVFMNKLMITLLENINDFKTNFHKKIDEIKILNDLNIKLKNNLVIITTGITEHQKNNFGDDEISPFEKVNEIISIPFSNNISEKDIIRDLEHIRDIELPEYFDNTMNTIKNYLKELEELGIKIEIQRISDLEENFKTKTKTKLEDMDNKINNLKDSNNDLKDKIITMLLIKKGQKLKNEQSIAPDLKIINICLDYLDNNILNRIRLNYQDGIIIYITSVGNGLFKLLDNKITKKEVLDRINLATKQNMIIQAIQVFINNYSEVVYFNPNSPNGNIYGTKLIEYNENRREFWKNTKTTKIVISPEEFKKMNETLNKIILVANKSIKQELEEIKSKKTTRRGLQSFGSSILLDFNYLLKL